MSMTAKGGNCFGYKTASSGTKIRRLLPPSPTGVTRATTVLTTGADASHTLTALRSLGKVAFTATGLAGQPDVTVAAEPGPSGNALAANDLVAIREIDGVTRLYVVSAVPGSYPGVVTLTTNLTAGVVASSSINCRLWDFGVAADTDPKTGEAHQYFKLAAAQQYTFADDEAGVAAGNAVDEPVLLEHSNATSAGSIDQVSYAYTDN